MSFRPLCLILAASVSWASAQLAENTTWIAAQQALKEGVFEVAALKAERLLAKKWNAKSRELIASLAVEASVRAGDAAKALRLLDAHDVTNAALWRGHALLMQGNADAASAVLEKAGDDPQVKLALAHALVGDGREGRARSVLRTLRDGPDEAAARHARLMFNELELNVDRSEAVLQRLNLERGGKDAIVQYLRARAHTEQGNLKTSEAILRDLLAMPQGSVPMMASDAAKLMLADVLWRSTGHDGRTMLIEFIANLDTDAHVGETAFLGESFDLLKRMSAGETTLASDSFARALMWASDEKVPLRRGYALVFVAEQLHQQGRTEEALGMLECLLQLDPQHPSCNGAMRLALRLHGTLQHDERVLHLAERWRAQYGGGGNAIVDFLVGLVNYTRGDYLKALSSFAKAATDEPDLPRRRRALYNAAVCAFKAGKGSAAVALMAQLNAAAEADKSKRGANRETSADVQLDHALSLASALDPKAEEELVKFVADQKSHARWAEANVALAEFCLLDVPPRVKPANEALAAAETATSASPTLKERIAYVRVWLEEARSDLPAVIKVGAAYLTAFPQSPRADEVHMKVGEAHYRQESYAKARTEFELLAKNRPKSPYADSALYYAGLAAMAIPNEEGLNAALAAWNELAERGGALAFAARRLQASAHVRKGDLPAATKLLGTLISDAKASATDRMDLRCERAELLINAGQTEASSLEQAVTELRALIGTEGIDFLHRARAGVLLATALREQSKRAEALEACYDVVNLGSALTSQPQTPTELGWYYRAGFLAIDLLEASAQWEAAAQMGERLAAAGGDRAKEASDRATKIRLQHFLWDGPR